MEQNIRSCNIEIQWILGHRICIRKLLVCPKLYVAFDIKSVEEANNEDGKSRAIIVKLATPRIRDTLLANINEQTQRW